MGERIERLAIVAALERELRPARRKIGRGAIYLAFGMGEKGVRARLKGFIEGEEPGMLILTGFAGGLQPGLRSGELLLAEGFLRPGAEGIWADQQLYSEAQEALGSAVQRGRLLTVARPASSAEKNRLGRDFPAVVVDMESWWAAELALKAEIPFLCLKAVLDPLNKPLPRPIARVGPDGRLTPGAWLELLREPGELLWWAWAAHRESGALARALSRLVEWFRAA